jgi:hypothetical protein
MKWKVEYITSSSVNILVDDPSVSDMDKEPVGMGFPQALAERIVEMHNQALDRAYHAGIGVDVEET